ncbi:MAG: 3'-5' exonuclease, partial [Myxococcota bacterium]
EGSIFAVGDPDQSIYAFRGADVRNVLDFERDFPGARVYRLEQNYRSTPGILRVASALIANNLARRDKDVWTENAEGAPVVLCECEDDRDEARFVIDTIRALRGEGVRTGDVAIFYRTHAQSRVLEEALRAADLAYVIVGGMRFYERAEVKDALAYLRVIHNPRDALDLRRIVNVPTRGIGDATLERVEALAAERGIGLWEAMVEITREGCESLKLAPQRKLAAFVRLIEELRAAAAHEKASRLLEMVLQSSGYLERLAIDGTPEAQARAENLEELLVSVRDYEESAASARPTGRADEPTLGGFLERIALVSDVDGYSEDQGRVSLMTVHSAKGLEFPAVFVAGIEEGVFPHARSLGSDDAIEEERRLCYVAMTRARERLYLSYALRRRVFNQDTPGRPSRFVREIPREHVTLKHRSSRARALAAPNSWRAPTEVWVDTADSQEASDDDAWVGMRVSHPKFGRGVVRAVADGSEDAKLTIDFPSVGRKTVLARFVARG